MPDRAEPAELSPNLHDRDFYSWAMETARALRERRLERVDWDSVAEELEDMGVGLSKLRCAPAGANRTKARRGGARSAN